MMFAIIAFLPGCLPIMFKLFSILFFQRVLLGCGVWLGMLFAVALIGCDSKVEPPLRVASHEWPGYEPLHLARDLGYYDERKIHVYEVPSATASIRAFRNGYIDVAALTLDEALLLLQDQVSIKILVVMDVSNGADAVLAHPSIRSLQDLKGKRIGVESSALGAYMLARTLNKAGLTEQDIQPQYIPYNKHPAAYQEGLVDALVTFEPNKSAILKLGAQVLIDSSQFPNEIFDVLVIRESAIAHNQETVHRLITGWFKALDYMNAHPDEAAARIAKRIDMTADEFLLALKDISIPDLQQNRAFLLSERPRLVEVGQQLAQIMIKNQLLVLNVAPERLIYADSKSLLTP